jgi:hypothetical protein
MAPIAMARHDRLIRVGIVLREMARSSCAMT